MALMGSMKIHRLKMWHLACLVLQQVMDQLLVRDMSGL
jgi:hypothetical protein